MRIKSDYRDYYDHVQALSDGGDPKNVYIRGRIKTANSSKSEIYIETDKFAVRPLPTDPRATQYKWYGTRQCCSQHYIFAWLVVTGKMYLVLKSSDEYGSFLQNTDTWSILNGGKHSDVYLALAKPHKKFDQRTGHLEYRNYNYYIGCELSILSEIARTIQAPVFLITSVSYSGIHIDSNVPNLRDTGIAALIDANHMYPNIEQYIINVLRESPDTKPPVHVSDRDQIVAKGFDYKQSFRHRKKT